jgi:hypothetical protein
VSKLRDYLEEKYRIPKHKETEDFCLEMLKTLDHNLRQHQERTMLFTQMLSSQQYSKDLLKSIEMIQLLHERTVSTFQKYEKLLKEGVS